MIQIGQRCQECFEDATKCLHWLDKRMIIGIRVCTNIFVNIINHIPFFTKPKPKLWKLHMCTKGREEELKSRKIHLGLKKLWYLF